MKAKQLSLGLISAAAFSLPSLATAQSTMDSMTKAMTGPDSGWLVGGSLGQSKIKIDCTGATCDDTDTAFRAFGGYNFNKNFGVELGYADLGKVTFSSGGLSGDVKATAWDVSAVGTLPLANSFSLYGKLGWYMADSKQSGSFGSGSDSNSDITYAIGGQYDFNKNLGLRAEWQQYKKVGGDNTGGTGDVDIFGVAVVYRFK